MENDARAAGRAERDVEVASLNEQLQAKSMEMDSALASKDAERLAFGEAEYARGVASVVCPEPLPSSDPELQAKLDEANAQIQELNAMVSSCRAEIDSLKAQVVEKDNERDQAVRAALSNAKARLDEAEASIFPEA